MRKLLTLILLSPLAFGNEYHEALMKMSTKEQRAFWTGFMQKSGEDCKPTTIKFLALTNYDGGSQWSIGCQTSNPNNKGGLWVNLKPNGDTKIMECKYLEQMGGSC